MTILTWTKVCLGTVTAILCATSPLVCSEDIPVRIISRAEMDALTGNTSPAPGLSPGIVKESIEFFDLRSREARAYGRGSVDRRMAVESALRIEHVPSATRAAFMSDMLQSDAEVGRIDLVASIPLLQGDAALIRASVTAAIERFLSDPENRQALPISICLAMLRSFPGDVYFTSLLAKEVGRDLPARNDMEKVAAFHQKSLSVETCQMTLEAILLGARGDDLFSRYVGLQHAHPLAIVRWQAAVAAAKLHLPIVNSVGVRLHHAEEMALWFALPSDFVPLPSVEPGTVAGGGWVEFGELEPGAPINSEWWIERFAVESTGIQTIAACRALASKGGITLPMALDLIGAGELLNDSEFFRWALVGLHSFQGDPKSLEVKLSELLKAPELTGHGAQHIICKWLATERLLGMRSRLADDICRSFQQHYRSMDQVEALDSMYLLSLLGPDAASVRSLLARIATIGSEEMRGREKYEAMRLRYGAVLVSSKVGVSEAMVPVLTDAIRHEVDPMIVCAAARAVASMGHKGAALVGSLLERLRIEVGNSKTFFFAFGLNHPAITMTVRNPSEWTTAALEIIRALTAINTPEVADGSKLVDEVLSRYINRTSAGPGRYPPLAQVQRVCADFKTVTAMREVDKK